MDPSTAASIPLTAWQQAAVIIIFTLFLGGVFAFVRWLLGWTSRQQATWQKYSSEQSKQWREWMDEQREKERESMTGVAEALKELGKKIDVQNQKIDAHDQKVDERIERVRGTRRAAK